MSTAGDCRRLHTGIYRTCVFMCKWQNQAQKTRPKNHSQELVIVSASRDHTARLCGGGTPYDHIQFLWNALFTMAEVILTSSRIRCKTCISREVQAMFLVWHSCFQWIPKAIFHWNRTIFHLFCSWALSNLLFCIKMAFVSLNNYTWVSVIKQVRRVLQVQNMCFVCILYISSASKIFN